MGLQLCLVCGYESGTGLANFASPSGVGVGTGLTVDVSEHAMIGRTITHYRIQSKLGEGGMGVVYRAEDLKLGRTVALKFLAPYRFVGDAARRRFQREAKAVAALDHPNICTVFEIEETEGTVFLAMALVEGPTVREMIAERPLKLEDALDIATQIAHGIRAAHEKGIVHRDIKPANVMVNPQRQVKIMDFGIAQLAGATTESHATVVGTPAYMSPEQIRGDRTDRRTDVWSLGVMLYEMITGRLPFTRERTEGLLHAVQYAEPEPVTALRSAVPIEMDWIVSKCLAKDVAERYQHMDDLIVDLSTLRKTLESRPAAPGRSGARTAAGELQVAVSTARFKHGFRNDIFISYTHADDRSDASGRQWVTKFEQDLQTRLGLISGRSIQIWRDRAKAGRSDRFDSEIAAQIRDSAVLVVVLTPSYAHSDSCRQERESFSAAAAQIGDRARIIKVAKTYVDLEMYPDDLRSLSEHRFYIEEESGVQREIHLHRDQAIRDMYPTLVDDVAHEVNTTLRQMEPAADVVAAGNVYLAETSSDLEEQRNAIRRCLLQQGYTVLPKAPLRLLSTPQLRAAIEADLASAHLTIHPIGARYGFIPELADGASIVRLQLECAAHDRRNGDLARLVWLPEGQQPDEELQNKFIREIRERWAGNPFQVIEASLQRFQTNLQDFLTRSQNPTPAATRRRPAVYVLCAGGDDRKAARGLRGYLCAQDLDVGSAAPSPERHARRLVDDDAFLIYYGQCPDEWVRDRIIELVDPKYSKRASPVLARAVFLADPQTDDKDDFLTNDARVIAGYGPVGLDQSLTPFLTDIRAGWARARAGASRDV